ncbi:hypothetical protein BAUCODRAFT_35175 [Baudoinia panamericana UAMH 10762]|uniref:Uncharacterized protein n=1 Tax=Baudoinia panamericana (strain UAMH 10762) TaxID=717646 RepID=M2MUD6_BAUPA|nr:uncharacterized protein BAUCODRAFT_35175 [Baudoinia panamericana UAMH 10762]EMC95183.1 hypothetical protein BAUCODRAFT_35175 [Baudoinia panamericana UAMH 10762]
MRGLIEAPASRRSDATEIAVEESMRCGRRAVASAGGCAGGCSSLRCGHVFCGYAGRSLAAVCSLDPAN